jgi:prolyl oligopeptidase
MSIDRRPTVSAPDDDPYLWLEEIAGARAVAWADAQSAATREAVMTSAALADRDMLAALMDRPDKLPRISRRGTHIYNLWQDKQSPRGLWRRTTLDDFRRAEPTWDVVFDVDALARAEGEGWVWGGANTLPGTHDRALISLSRGGSDASVLREFDMTSTVTPCSLPPRSAARRSSPRPAMRAPSDCGDAVRTSAPPRWSSRSTQRI